MFGKDEKELKVIEQDAVVTPMDLIKTANQQGTDLDKMQQLMDLQERWEANEAKKAFVVAMSKFRNNCPTIYKTKKGHNSKYAGLAKTIEDIKEFEAECELSHSWKTKQENELIGVTCIVTHVLGHSESTYLESPAETSGNKTDIQGIGSAVEYLKRYTFFAVFGLSSEDEDNDGNSRVTFEQAEELENLADEAGVDKGKFLVYFQAGSFNHLPAKQYKNALAAIKKKKESKK